MKFAITSDIHLGDPMCTLVDHQTLDKGDKYEEFLSATGNNNDYLILLGDILDFSINSYCEAYRVAKAFFKYLQDDKVAQYIIYVPGNHDFDIWHTVEHQVNTIYQLRKGRSARKFSFSVPGVLDLRSGSKNKKLQLISQTDSIQPSEEPNERMFLNSITKNEDGSGSETQFYFAYPNIYFVTDKYSVLMTHGHFLESFWSLAGEWEMKIAREDLKLGDEVDLKEMAALNFPLCQLSCSGVGQAGPLTKLVQTVQREIKDQKLERVERYLDNLDDEIDKLISYSRLDPREWGSDLLSDHIKKFILDKLREMKDTRYSEEFIHKKEVLDRFRRFFEASMVEIYQLNERNNTDIPLPNKVIFGHTHQPIALGAVDVPWATVAGGRPVKLYNTGGWLRHVVDDTPVFCGAEVFTYDDDKGLVSNSIR
jgi:UDP-2,3-diacylglucosamine pyrophosphatase LpxH